MNWKVCISFVFGTLFGLFLTCLYFEYFPEHFSDLVRFVSISIGGVAGGFTAALGGKKSYGLRMPRKSVDGASHVEAGFLGDLAVGLSSGFLGIGVVSGLLRPELFAMDSATALEIGIRDFSVAFVSGFLGLRLIREVSKKMFDIREINDRLEQTELETDYLVGEHAIDVGLYHQALQIFDKIILLEGRTDIRGYIGRARALKRLNRYKEAVESLDLAIDLANRESINDNLGIAYFNRACYKALLREKAKAEPVDIETIAADLEYAFRLRPEFRKDAAEDTDLKSVIGDDNIRKILESGS